MRTIFLSCSRDRISQWTQFLLLSLDNNKITNPKPQASSGMHQPTQLFYVGPGSSPACMTSIITALPSPLSRIGTSYIFNAHFKAVIWKNPSLFHSEFLRGHHDRESFQILKREISVRWVTTWKGGRKWRDAASSRVEKNAVFSVGSAGKHLISKQHCLSYRWKSRRSCIALWLKFTLLNIPSCILKKLLQD